MRTKKFKTAQGFLESHYNDEDHHHCMQHTYEERAAEAQETKIQRIKQAQRNAIRALLPAIGLFNIQIDDDEDLKQAIQRIQQMPEAQDPRYQHFLKGALQWLKRARLISISSRMIGVTSTSPE